MKTSIPEDSAKQIVLAPDGNYEILKQDERGKGVHMAYLGLKEHIVRAINYPDAIRASKQVFEVSHSRG